MSLPRTIRAGTSSIGAVSRSLAPRYGPMVCRRFKSGEFGYTQAKALVYSKHGDPSDVLSLHTYSISPVLPDRCVLLRALATPINPADVNQIQGVYPDQPVMSTVLGTNEESATCGNEGCFEVTAVAPDAQGVEKGDWVIMRRTCFGTWRTHALATTDEIMKIDNKEGLTPIQVGTVAVNPTTAYRMLKDFQTLEKGDWFVQNGANSGVGRAAIQLGKLWGYQSLNIIRDRKDAEATQEMKDELMALGATKVVTESELMAQGFSREWVKWTAGKIRLGLNCVGGKPTQLMIKTLGPGGHLVTYGGMARAPLDLPTGLLIFRDIKFSGFWVSRWSDDHVEEKQRTVEEILELTRKGLFKDVPVSQVQWNWDTTEQTLKDAVAGTLGGFRPGKSVFVYDDN